MMININSIILNKKKKFDIFNYFVYNFISKYLIDKMNI